MVRRGLGDFEAESRYGQPRESPFEPISVGQTDYSIANAGFNKSFLTSTRLTKARVTCTRWVFLTSPR